MKYVVQRARVRLCGVVMLLGIVSVHAVPGFGQTSDLAASAAIERIMTTALSRCYSTVDGVKTMTLVPASNEEFAEVKAFGPRAVAPLAEYLNLEPKGFTQLFAVRFLVAIHDPSTFDPLKRAFAEDQWDVTRVNALYGMFYILPTQAKPYVEAALGDKSQRVRQHAGEIWREYQKAR